MTKLRIDCNKDDRFIYGCDAIQEELEGTTTKLKRAQAELFEMKCRCRELEIENVRVCSDRESLVSELNKLIRKVSAKMDATRLTPTIDEEIYKIKLEKMTEERDKAISENKKNYYHLCNEVASRVRVDNELKKTKLELDRVVNGIRGVIGDVGNNKEAMDATEKR